MKDQMRVPLVRVRAEEECMTMFTFTTLMIHGQQLLIDTDLLFFFFSSRRRHTRFDCDWNSDVCSSDLFSVIDFADRLLRWLDDGYMAVDGDVFDVGVSTAEALGRLRDGMPPRESGGKDEYDCGNGSRSEERRVGKECR